MITIRLDNLKFSGRHGLFPEETFAGGWFLVSASVKVDTGGLVRSMENTVNYAALYEVISMRMSRKEELLEVLAQDICSGLLSSDRRIRYASVAVTKSHPPIEGFSGEITVVAEQSADVS